MTHENDNPGDPAVDDTTSIRTDVGNKVVPHQRAVTYATKNWLVKLSQQLKAFAERPSDGRHLAKRSFAITGIGTIDTSFVDSFEVASDFESDPPEVVVNYTYRGSRSLSAVPSTKEAYFALRDILKRHGLQHKSAIASTIAKVQLDPIVPAQMRFTADLKEAAIYCEFKNVEELCTTSHRLSPHDCSTDMLHAIEDLILGNTIAFYSKAGALVSREERIELSRKLSIAAQNKAPAAPAGEPEAAGIFDKLRKAINKH